MIPKLTDDAVSRLPLEAGRAELLEEIMTTVAPDRPTAEPTPIPTRPRRGWLVPAAAAAVVIGIATASLWSQGLGPGSRPSSPSVATQPDGAGNRAVLDAPGWTVSATESGDHGYGEVDYEKAGASFAITWYPASQYDSYVQDREHIVDPPAPGEPIQVLGRSGQMWAYSADDHTVIREVEGDQWMEVRGSGMNEAAFRDLLGQLRQVDQAAYEGSLPDGFVTTAERPARIQQMLDGIVAVTGVEGPGGRTISVQSTDQDPYQLGAAVAGAYSCAWLKEFETATTAGDSSRADEAARVLETSRDWPVLKAMNDRGDYPEVVWDLGDQVAQGHVPEGYWDGMCSS